MVGVETDGWITIEVHLPKNERYGRIIKRCKRIHLIFIFSTVKTFKIFKVKKNWRNRISLDRDTANNMLKNGHFSSLRIDHLKIPYFGGSVSLCLRNWVQMFCYNIKARCLLSYFSQVGWQQHSWSSHSLQVRGSVTRYENHRFTPLHYTLGL